MAWTVAIGVDTHKDAHVAVALDWLGARLDSCMVEPTAAGYQRLLAWAVQLGCPAFAVEGCGSYGAGLARFLEAAGVAVFECERPRRGERRRGKSDVIGGGLRSRPGGVCDVLRRIGRRAEWLSDEIEEIDAACPPSSLRAFPSGSANAAWARSAPRSWSSRAGDSARMASEAPFAALAGTSPVEASSGKQRRHRLNRGGDRQLNWALHVIALQRVRYHAETASYYLRLLADGKTRRKPAAASNAPSPATSTTASATSPRPLDNIEASASRRWQQYLVMMGSGVRVPAPASLVVSNGGPLAMPDAAFRP